MILPVVVELDSPGFQIRSKILNGIAVRRVVRQVLHLEWILLKIKQLGIPLPVHRVFNKLMPVSLHGTLKSFVCKMQYFSQVRIRLADNRSKTFCRGRDACRQAPPAQIRT